MSYKPQVRVLRRPSDKGQILFNVQSRPGKFYPWRTVLSSDVQNHAEGVAKRIDAAWRQGEEVVWKN